MVTDRGMHHMEHVVFEDNKRCINYVDVCGKLFIMGEQDVADSCRNPPGEPKRIQEANPLSFRWFVSPERLIRPLIKTG